MCGICGVVDRAPVNPVPESTLVAMRDALVHRGPDDAGLLLEPHVALASRRLAILDLSPRGHMPMVTREGRFCIVYNGEVYNFAELRNDLIRKGYHFASNTDTEVVLNMYAEYGPAMLERLNGMFAIAIWDRYEQTLFLARDRLGIKPLYYAMAEDKLYFASEQKAIFAAGIRAEFDDTCWEEALGFRYVAGENTPFRGIVRLLPGHYLLWKSEEVSIRRWWNLADRARALREQLPADPEQWFEETFLDAVSKRQISDVPVGVLLSGGMDSGSVAASLRSRGGATTASFTVRFREAGYDEGPLAQQVAQQYGLEHHEVFVEREDLFSGLQKSSWMSDEPLSHANSLHLWAISDFAKPLVTVLLSGEGGDETLGGYVRYRPLRYANMLSWSNRWLGWLPRTGLLRGRWRKLHRVMALQDPRRMVLYNSCDAFSEDLSCVGLQRTALFGYRERVLEEAQGLYPAEPFRQAMYLDLHTFLCSILDRNDRMTMGASVECRIPFLDYRLVEMLAAMPTSIFTAHPRGKHLLRATVGRRLPTSIVRHRKWGFGVPWRIYLREVPDLRRLVIDLPTLPPFCDGPFDPQAMKRVVTDFLQGSEEHEELVRQLVFMAIWYDACIRNPLRAPGPAPFRLPPATWQSSLRQTSTCAE